MKGNSLWKTFPSLLVVVVLLVPVVPLSLPGTQSISEISGSTGNLPYKLLNIAPRQTEPPPEPPASTDPAPPDPPPAGPTDPPPAGPTDPPPAGPTDPPPSNPTEPSVPTDPVETTVPTEPVVDTPGPTEPVDTVVPTEPVDTVVPTEPVDTVVPTEPTSVVETPSVTETALPTEIAPFFPFSSVGKVESSGSQPLPPLGPRITVFTLSTDSTVAGNLVTIHAVVDSNRPGGTRILVSCGGLTKVETNEVMFNSTWNTKGCPAGQARVTLLTRDFNDTQWLNPGITSMTLYVSAELGAASPAAGLSVDNEKVRKGQCTVMHWATSGAKSVDLDGVVVPAVGDIQVCPLETKQFTLIAHGVKENVTRNVTVLVTAPASPTGAAAQFRNGSVIKIGEKFFLIFDGLRHLVPNLETLQALGYSRESVDNLGLAEKDLLSILVGQDLPDKKNDPGLIEKLRAYLSPAQSVPATAVEPVPAPIPAINADQPASPALVGPRENAVYSEGVSLKFDWSSSSNDSLLQISGGPYAEPILCGWQFGTTCTVREFLAGTYTWQVKSRSSSGQESEWSKPNTFSVQTGALDLPFIPVTGESDGRQVVGSCTLFCQVRLFGIKVWNSLWNVPMTLPATIPETADSFLANHTIREGSQIGAHKSSSDLVKRLTDLSGFEESDDANAYIQGGGKAQPLTDISQLMHCSTLFFNIGKPPTPTHTAFVYGVNPGNKMLTIIQQNNPVGKGVQISNINFTQLDLTSTYFVNTKCK